jgi:hypothetical protein
MPYEDRRTAIASDQEQFLEKLGRMRVACQLQRRPPRRDITQRHCPAVAYQMMQGLSRRPIASSPKSPFRVITALVCQALTGEPVSDLKRQCEEFLRLVRR